MSDIDLVGAAGQLLPGLPAVNPVIYCAIAVIAFVSWWGFHQLYVHVMENGGI